jgi:hypothetical protein
LRDTNHIILTISVASHGFLCHHSSSVTRRNERWYVLVSVAPRMAAWRYFLVQAPGFDNIILVSPLLCRLWCRINVVATNYALPSLLGNCRLASAPTLLDIGRTPRVDEELKRQFPNHHNYIQLRDLITYHLAPSDLILFSALPSSLSFPVVDEILMTSQGPSRALRRLIPEVAIEPPGLTILICCISPWNVSNFLSRK